MELMMLSPYRYLARSCLILLTLNLSACFAPLPEDFGMEGGNDNPGSSAECRFNSDCELGFRCEEGACVEQEA